MNNKTILGLVFITLALLNSDKVTAVEPLSSAELDSHCTYYREDPEGKDGIFCVRYVQGFIDGAIATDERVTQNVANEYEQEESFSERAIRIRLGQRIQRYGASYYAEFCLGAPVPLVEVVQKVVSSLESPDFIEQNPLARDIVYLTLREHYPCEVD